MTEIPQNVMLDCLWSLWEQHPPTTDPKGDRIFLRHVDYDEDDGGWQDWTLWGIIRPGGIEWLSDELTGVQELLAEGETYGSGEYGDKILYQWCRSSLDGPPNQRVSDWAK